MTVASAKKGPSGRRARGSLIAGEILSAAKRLVEREGIRQLSMPSLARELDSGVTSIYWYFRSKEELLEALTDDVFSEMHERLPPVGDGPWDEELLSYFLAFRDLLEQFPVYREINAFRAHLLFRRPVRGLLQRLEEGLALLVRAGLTPEDAAGAFTACSNYARGFVALQHSQDTTEYGGHGTDPVVRVEGYEILSSIHPKVEDLVPLDDESFVLGLRLLIAGIRQTYSLGVTGERTTGR